MEKAILSVPEAAEILGVTESRVRQLIRKGKIDATTIGPVYAILRSDVLAYKAGPRRPGPVPRQLPAATPTPASATVAGDGSGTGTIFLTTP